MDGLNILLHIRASGGGGAERVFAILANGFTRRGAKVTLAVDEVIDADDLDPGVELVDLGRSHPRAVLRLAGLIRHKHPDILIAGVAVSNVKMALAKTLAMSRTPLVLSYHGFKEYKTGRLSALAYYGMSWLRLITRRFVCVSDGLRRTLIDNWRAPAGRTERIYNPVPFPPSRTQAATIAARPPIVGAVGRLSREKGMDVLVRALARMKTRDARLLIGGDGPERPLLDRLAAELGVEDRVDFLGAVNGPSAVFGTARVAAIPSRTEAFGMTTVEALAHGLAVVASDCDGPHEILAGGHFGQLVPVENADALAAALDRALAAPHDPLPGYRRANDFSVETGLDSWQQTIEAVIAGRL